MNVLFCGDSGICKGVLLSTMSLLRTCTQRLDIYLLTAGVRGPSRSFQPIPPAFAHRLDELVREAPQGGAVRRIDISEHFNACPPTANMATRFTPCCMLRLYADLVPELPDRLLYLDYDVVARLDCAGLYGMDLEGYEVAGVLDYYGRWLFSSEWNDHDYLNSGVLLMNLARIRETGLFERSRRQCATKRMFMPDQSALNDQLIARLILPRRFNEQRKLQPDTVLQHFSTTWRLFPVPHIVTVKPWQEEAMHKRLKLHEYDDLLAAYSQRAKELLDEPTKGDAL